MKYRATAVVPDGEHPGQPPFPFGAQPVAVLYL